MASTTQQKPRLRLRRGTPADASALARIHFNAFGPGVMNRLLYPTGITDDALARMEGDIFPQPKEEEEGQVELIVMVAELLPEDEHGQPEIVAYAKYSLTKEPLPESRWSVRRDKTAEELGGAVNVQVYNAFLGDLHQLKAKHSKGQPCLHLGILACTSNRQRLGAGSALLAWGNALADREGLVHWLEASPHGYSLYRQFGFEDVGVQDLNITKLWGTIREEHENWGAGSAVVMAGPLADGCHRTVIMRRLPQTS